MDTNSIIQLASHALDPRPSTLNTLNAWHLVALGAGAYLAHAYHSIKDAGGIKNILRGLWDGGVTFGVPPSGGPPAPAEAGTPNAQPTPAQAGSNPGAPIPSPDTRHSSPL